VVAHSSVTNRKPSAGGIRLYREPGPAAPTSARLKSLMKNAFVGCEIEQGLKAQVNEMCSSGGTTEVMPCYKAHARHFSARCKVVP
jgi:hypothetical protein